MKNINIYVLGTGLIGGTLLEQIYTASDTLKKNKMHLKIISIANSKKYYFKSNGISLDSWRDHLNKKGKDMNLRKYVETIINTRISNTIFVDCTASKDTKKWYAPLLKASVAIVTPNKKANSSTLLLYNKIKKAADKSFFLYETNVGAGLPVIETIDNLIMTGDTIIKIEGILSGTLSYLFNNFNGNKKFSALVKEAQQKGYTEPDPRDDLNGLDVGRKLLILAREIGLQIDLASISIENLVPKPCRNTDSIDTFFTQLQKHDAYFESLKERALKDKGKLCYIAELDVKKNIFTCQLNTVPADHPFYSLSGSDNIIAITTKRYCNTPLVIKGPGAGAEVTAAGVFADIIKIAKLYGYKK